jgi:hypothetical protein
MNEGCQIVPELMRKGRRITEPEHFWAPGERIQEPDERSEAARRRRPEVALGATGEPDQEMVQIPEAGGRPLASW